ncbi:putative phospholipase B-like 2 [Halotydeus destructor]|nr:putative phospholipase B-like 2 [Halotydeus destructor]
MSKGSTPPGWAQLEIHTNPDAPDSYQAYFAGFIEGFLTSQLIEYHHYNLFDGYCDREQVYCDKVTSYLESNLHFVSKQVRRERSTDPYWHQVGLMLEQLSGLDDGYKLAQGSPEERKNVDLLIFDALGPKIADPSVLASPDSMLWLNMAPELFDLEYVFNRTSITNVDEDGYCSALIKLVPERNELFVGHNAWITYNYMLRFVKKYDFHYHTLGGHDSEVKTIVPACAIAFSSYPGTIFSIDDFYVLSSGLVVTETSIQNSNPQLYKYVDQPDKVVLEFMRTMVANRLSRTGSEWTEQFDMYNSGTYNNQFMIIDYNKFNQWLHYKSYSSSPEGILWIIEQMPGTSERADLTPLLLDRKYFSSYNRPYFPRIFNISGAQSLVDQYGSYYTYEATPRALIFARDHTKVTSLETMYSLMRYNDFKNDPLAACNCTPPYTAIAAIAARNDLNDPYGVYPVPPFGFRGSGAIDAKITSFKMSQRLEFVAISGPTYEGQPAFNWSTAHPAISSLRHRGQPELFQFAPQKVQWYPAHSSEAF